MGEADDSHDPAAYGDRVGAAYDVLYPDSHAFLETDATVAALERLTRSRGSGGSLLELGVGTGRLALALVGCGIAVAGIEASEAVADQLRSKPRGGEVELVVGDFATSRLKRRFSVVTVCFNTIFALPTREAQIECFRNAARHLEPGGCFVVEAYVLRPEQLAGDWSVWPRFVEDEHVELQLARYDVAAHRVERSLVHLRPDGVRLVPARDTYAWPGELDLMASIAGLTLRSRTGGWRDEPFDPSSHRHVSVYD